MASIRFRNGRFQVQVRIKGQPSKTKSFTRRKDAERWAREITIAAERGILKDRDKLSASLKEVLVRYLVEVAAEKRSFVQEQNRLERLIRDPIAETNLIDLTPEKLVNFRNRRIRDGKRTCHYDLVLISHALKIAMREWGYPIHFNPVDRIRKPGFNKPRSRRLEPGEYERFERAAKTCRNKWLWPLINLAIETAMRKGELLSLVWDKIDFHKRTAYLPLTKNGEDRLVPLSRSALNWINQLARIDNKLFPVTSVAVRHSWDRLARRAGIQNFHFHDLRREAITRFAERGLNVQEIASISGHRDYRVLARYHALRAHDIAKKMDW